jgi:hypothetical protein
MRPHACVTQCEEVVNEGVVVPGKNLNTILNVSGLLENVEGVNVLALKV